MRIKHLAAFIIALAIAVPGAAQAIPAFSKKYESPCSQCHGSWPRLNEVGMKFKMNGYQMPDSEDGGETGKTSPGENLFLDIGSANPPISLRVQGGMVLIQPEKGPQAAQEDKFFCCTEGAAVTLAAGGTVAPNIAFWLSLPWGKENVEQAYVRFVNWFGPGVLNVDLGAMKVVDNDVVAEGREWFGSPLIALHGSPYNFNGGEIGMAAPHNDTGFRLYGRPAYSTFSYEIGVFTGSRLTAQGDDDSNLAYTFMGRIDSNSIAFSARYWINRTGLIDLTAPGASGETLSFPADSANTDEVTQQFILSARYTHPMFEVDATLDRTSFDVSGRTSSDGASTLSQEAVNRTAVSVGAIWKVNGWFEAGAAYGFSQVDGYSQTVDGVKTSVPEKQTGLAQLRASIIPSANVKIGIEAQIDLSASDSLKRADGTEFDSQNKVLMQWDFTF